MGRTAPGGGPSWGELAELLPNGEVDRFEHTERLGMDLERVGAIHFEPEEGRKAETDLIRDRDGYITVGGTSEHGRPAVCNGRKSDRPLTAIQAASQRGIRDLREGMLTRIDRNPVLIIRKWQKYCPNRQR